MGDIKRLFVVLPAQQRCVHVFLADLDDILLESHPESSVLCIADDIGRVDFYFVRFALIESDDRFRIVPAADEYFHHGIGYGVAAQQADVGVVLALDIERQSIATIAFTFHWMNTIFLLLSGDDFCPIFFFLKFVFMNELRYSNNNNNKWRTCHSEFFVRFVSEEMKKATD